MKRLIVAVCAGSGASLFGLLVGVSTPGSWAAEVAGRPARGYDIYIHDHYFIVRPEVLLVNLVAFSIVAYSLMRPWAQGSRGQQGGAGA